MTGVSLGLHSNLFPTNSKAATAETSFHVAAAPSARAVVISHRPSCFANRPCETTALSASTLRNPYAPARTHRRLPAAPFLAEAKISLAKSLCSQERSIVAFAFPELVGKRDDQFLEANVHGFEPGVGQTTPRNLGLDSVLQHQGFPSRLVFRSVPGKLVGKQVFPWAFIQICSRQI